LGEPLRTYGFNLKPVSTNEAYKVVRFPTGRGRGGRKGLWGDGWVAKLALSAEGARFKRDLIMSLTVLDRARGLPPPASHGGIELRWRFHVSGAFDADGVIKLAQDAAAEYLGVNDRSVTRFLSERIPSGPATNWIVLQVYAYEEDDSLFPGAPPPPQAALPRRRARGRSAL
jgi:hypothetical protein